jgi:hypothetical protein
MTHAMSDHERLREGQTRQITRRISTTIKMTEPFTKAGSWYLMLVASEWIRMQRTRKTKWVWKCLTLGNLVFEYTEGSLQILQSRHT